MLGSIAKLALKSSQSLNKLANRGFIGGMIAEPIKQVAKPFLRLKWLLRADKQGRVNIFKNIARRMKVRKRALSIQVKRFSRHPFRSTKTWIRSAIGTVAMGLAGAYVLKTLMGSNGNSKPSGSNTPSFDPSISPASGIGNSTSPGGSDSIKTAGLLDKATKGNAKAETANKLADAKAELTAATKAANEQKPFVSKVPSKLEEIHARGKSSDEKLDAIIKLLNQGNQIQNENRRSNEEQLKRQEQEVKNRLYKSSELYRNLTKLQAQQNSANADAIKTGLASSGDKVSKALASQTSAYRSQAKEAKKSSLLKWLLFGGIALGVANIAKYLGGVGELLSGGFDLMSKGFHGIGNMLGLLHDDNTDLASGETVGDTSVDNDKFEDKNYNKEDKAKDDDSIKSTIDKKERLSDKLGTSADKAASVATAAYAGRKVANVAKTVNSMANNSATLKAEKALGKSMVAEQKAAVKQAKEALSTAKKSGDKKAIQKARKALKSAKQDLSAAKALSKSATRKSAIGSTASKVKSTVTSAASAVKDTAVDMMKDSAVDKEVEKVKGGLKKVGSKIAKNRLGKFVTDRLVRILGAKIAAKASGRLIPGLGIGIGVLAAGRRIMRGDWLGAFGEIASTTAAQLGELGVVATGGLATAAGIGASLAIDSLVLMHDQRMAVKYAEEGNLKNLLDMGFEPADIAEMIYNAVDESGNPAPLHRSHPLRRNFESKYKTVVSIASGKDIVPAIILAQGILDHNAPLYKDYEKNYNSVQKLLDRHLSWIDIAEIVQSSDPNGSLFKDFMKYYDEAVPSIMGSDSRTNDNALVLGKIAQKSTGEFRKKFETQYGDPTKFINKHDKLKKSPLSKVLRGFKWGADKFSEGASWAGKALAAPFKWAGKGLKGLLNIGEDTVDRIGLTKLFKGKTRVEKLRRENAINAIAKENGIVVSDKGEPGTVTPQQFHNEYKDQIEERLKTEKAPKDTFSSIKSGVDSAVDSTKSGFRSARDSIKSGFNSAVDSTKSGLRSARDSIKSGFNSAVNSTKSGFKSALNSAKSAWNWFAGYASGTKFKGVDQGVSHDQFAFVGDRAKDDSDYAKFNSKDPKGGKPEVIERVDGSVQVVGGDSAQGHLTILNKGDKVKPVVEPKLKELADEATKRKGFVEVEHHADDKGAMSKDQMKRALTVTKWLVDNMGLTPQQAVGVAGVWTAESGCNPASVNKQEKAGKFPGSAANGPGYGAGMAQWSLVQRKKKALDGINRLSGKSYNLIEQSTMEDQLKWFREELTNGNYKILLDKLKAVNNPTDSADIMLRGYENGNGHGRLATKAQIDSYVSSGGYQGSMFGNNGRAVYAQRILNSFNGNPNAPIDMDVLQSQGTVEDDSDSTSVNGIKSIDEILSGMTSLADPISTIGSNINFAEGTAIRTTPAIDKARRSGWNIPNSIKSLNSHAKRRSTGYCARYVRQALEAGGINTAGRPSSATDYDSYLPKVGFEYQDPSKYRPQTGDICVIKASRRHKHGHISMFNGKNWISDFVQNRINGDVYGNTGGPLLYFRYKALGNSNPGDLSSIASYGIESDFNSSSNYSSPFRVKSIGEILSGMSSGISLNPFRNVNPHKIQASATGSSDTGIRPIKPIGAEGKGDGPITAAVTKPIQSNITKTKSDETNNEVKSTSNKPQKTIVDNSGGNTIANSFNTVNNHYHSECKIEQERNPLSNLMNS